MRESQLGNIRANVSSALFDFYEKCVILFVPVTLFFHDTTGVRELIFSFELDHPAHTKHDANEAFKERYGYDPVLAEHIEIEFIKPQLRKDDW